MALPLRFVPVALLLFVLAQVAYATTEDKPPEGDDIETSAILPEKTKEVDYILMNPPEGIIRLMKDVPFHIYGKDKRGNYFSFCITKNINWDAVGDGEAVSEYVKYMALFFWKNVDKRPNSALSIVVDAEDLPFTKVLNGSATTLLTSIIQGLEKTRPYLGIRSGRVFVVNSPGFLSPVLKLAAKLLQNDVDFVPCSSREQWEPILKSYVGIRNLPVEYGGKNPTKVSDSRVVKFIEGSVAKIVRQKNVGLKEQSHWPCTGSRKHLFAAAR